MKKKTSPAKPSGRGTRADGPVVLLTDVSRSYKTADTKGAYALRDVSLRIERGEYVAVTGPSGSGKSTLMHIISGVDSPTSGEALICGEPIYKMDDDSLSEFRRAEIGTVYQFFNLIPVLNVEENIGFPLLAEGRVPGNERVHRLMRQLGIFDCRSMLPNQLSGGQQQRVAIGRAVVSSPSLILADEPTGNLDSQNGAQVISLFETLCREEGATLIIVTHDPTIAARADRVIRLEDGRIVSDERRGDRI